MSKNPKALTPWLGWFPSGNRQTERLELGVEINLEEQIAVCMALKLRVRLLLAQ